MSVIERFNGVSWELVGSNYTHPTDDGNLHVPSTGTTNDGKVLTAGATAGSFSWQSPISGSVHINQSLLDSLTSNGSSNEFLSADGTYKTINITGFVDHNHDSNYLSLASSSLFEPIGTIIKNGNGDKFLSDDGNYTNINVTGFSLLNHNHDSTYLSLASSGTSVDNHEFKYTHSNIHTHTNKTTLDTIPTPTTNDEGKTLKVNSTHTGYELTTEYCSAGVIGTNPNDPTITVNGLVATIPSCNVTLFDNATFSGVLRKYTIAQKDLTLTDNAVNYIYVDYNNGNPEYRNTINLTNEIINESSSIPINTLLVTNSIPHSAHWDSLADGLSNKLHRRLVKTQRYARESGLSLYESSPGVLTISEGIVWRGGRAFDLKETNSDGTNNTQWFFYHHTNNSWTLQYPASAYDNTQYDDGSNLVSLTGTKYTINWIFRGVEDHQHGYYILGNKEYKDEPTAIAETSIPTLPIDISSHAILVGRVIVQRNSTTLKIESAFTNTFQGSVINEHNDLSGIQGGLLGNYFHTPEEIYLTNPSSGEILVRNNSQWINSTIDNANIAQKVHTHPYVSNVYTSNGISGVVENSNLTLSLNDITPTTVNGLYLTTANSGFTIAGGTTSKTLTVDETANLSGKMNNLITTKGQIIIGDDNGTPMTLLSKNIYFDAFDGTKNIPSGVTTLQGLANIVDTYPDCNTIYTTSSVSATSVSITGLNLDYTSRNGKYEIHFYGQFITGGSTGYLYLLFNSQNTTSGETQYMTIYNNGTSSAGLTRTVGCVFSTYGLTTNTYCNFVGYLYSIGKYWMIEYMQSQTDQLSVTKYYHYPSFTNTNITSMKVMAIGTNSAIVAGAKLSIKRIS